MVEVEFPQPVRRGARAALARWHEAEKRRRPFAGLRFFTKCSDGRRDIAGRHWPSSLTWSWFLTFRWPDGGKSGAHHKWGIHRYTHNSGGWFVIGPFWYYWQEEMPHKPTNYAAEKRFIAALANGPDNPNGTESK